jgi:hypothetical protein
MPCIPSCSVEKGVMAVEEGNSSFAYINLMSITYSFVAKFSLDLNREVTWRQIQRPNIFQDCIRSKFEPSLICVSTDDVNSKFTIHIFNVNNLPDQGRAASFQTKNFFTIGKEPVHYFKHLKQFSHQIARIVQVGPDVLYVVIASDSRANDRLFLTKISGFKNWIGESNEFVTTFTQLTGGNDAFFFDSMDTSSVTVGIRSTSRDQQVLTFHKFNALDEHTIMYVTINSNTVANLDISGFNAAMYVENVIIIPCFLNGPKTLSAAALIYNDGTLVEKQCMANSNEVILHVTQRFNNTIFWYGFANQETRVSLCKIPEDDNCVYIQDNVDRAACAVSGHPLVEMVSFICKASHYNSHQIFDFKKPTIRPYKPIVLLPPHRVTRILSYGKLRYIVEQSGTILVAESSPEYVVVLRGGYKVDEFLGLRDAILSPAGDIIYLLTLTHVYALQILTKSSGIYFISKGDLNSLGYATDIPLGVDGYTLLISGFNATLIGIAFCSPYSIYPCYDQIRPITNVTRGEVLPNSFKLYDGLIYTFASRDFDSFILIQSDMNFNVLRSKYFGIAITEAEYTTCLLELDNDLLWILPNLMIFHGRNSFDRVSMLKTDIRTCVYARIVNLGGIDYLTVKDELNLYLYHVKDLQARVPESEKPTYLNQALKLPFNFDHIVNIDQDYVQYIDDIGNCANISFVGCNHTPGFLVAVLVPTGTVAAILAIIILVPALIVAIFGKSVIAKLRVLKKYQVANREMQELLLEMKTMQNAYLDPSSDAYKWLIKLEDIKFEERIAEGSFGVVFLGSYKGLPVAVKKLKRDDSDDDFVHEVRMLSSIRHPNIVLFIGVGLTEDSKYIVTEYMSGRSVEYALFNNQDDEGDVRDPSRPLHVNMSFKQKVSILIDVAQGLSHLHRMSIIHRDIKLQNFLIDSHGTAKICDFGASKFLTNVTTAMTSNIGTVQYMAPEIILECHNYNEKCDLYSFGIAMYEMFYEFHAYRDITYELNSLFSIAMRVAQHELRPSEPDFNLNDLLPTERLFLDIMHSCWETKPEARPTVAEVCERLEHIRKLL